MALDEETKENLRLGIESHRHCAHKDPTFCHMLILAELAMRRGYPVTSDEELEECGHFIADAVLESLILKGLVEMSGMSEDGQMMVGLTEAGMEIAHNKFEEKENGSE